MCSCYCLGLERSCLLLYHRAFKTVLKCPLLCHTSWLLSAEGHPLQKILFLLLSANHLVLSSVYMFTSPIGLSSLSSRTVSYSLHVPSSNIRTGIDGCSRKVCLMDVWRTLDVLPLVYMLRWRSLDHRTLVIIHSLLFSLPCRNTPWNKALPGLGQIQAAWG